MKSAKKFMRLFIIFFVLFLAAPQYFPVVNPQATVEAAPMKLNKKKATLLKGEKLTLKVNGAKQKVIWKSSDRKIATVSKTGIISAKKKGNVTIKAIIGRKVLNCSIRVETPSISQKNISLYVGETYNLKLNGNSQKIKWSSSDESIATVNSHGKVTAKKTGTAKIVAKISNRKYICSINIVLNQQVTDTITPSATVTPPIDLPGTEEGIITYVLNTSTKKFHNVSCRDIANILPENYKNFYKTRNDALAMGYSPCGHCKP